MANKYLLTYLPIVKKAEFLSHATQSQKMTLIQQNGIPKGFQKIQVVSHYSTSVSRNNSKCLDFVLVQVTSTVQKKEFSPILHKIKK